MGSRQLVVCCVCTDHISYVWKCCLTWLCIPGHLALVSGACIRPFLLFQPIAACISDYDSHYVLGLFMLLFLAPHENQCI